MPWLAMIDFAATHNLLGLRLYVIASTPTNGLGSVLANLEGHVAYQTTLERDGIMFAAGPLASEDLSEWLGEGLFMYRADSIDAACKIAAADPMHSSGARTFTVREWMMNEGSYTVQVYYSAGIRPQVR
ncbi:YciI family protein [Mycobacterium sp. BMJ-28]